MAVLDVIGFMTVTERVKRPEAIVRVSSDPVHVDGRAINSPLRSTHTEPVAVRHDQEQIYSEALTVR